MDRRQTSLRPRNCVYKWRIDFASRRMRLVGMSLAVNVGACELVRWCLFAEDAISVHIIRISREVTRVSSVHYNTIICMKWMGRSRWDETRQEIWWPIDASMLWLPFITLALQNTNLTEASHARDRCDNLYKWLWSEPGQVIIDSCRQRGVRLTELIEVRLWELSHNDDGKQSSNQHSHHSGGGTSLFHHEADLHHEWPLNVTRQHLWATQNVVLRVINWVCLARYESGRTHGVSPTQNLCKLNNICWILVWNVGCSIDLRCCSDCHLLSDFSIFFKLIGMQNMSSFVSMTESQLGRRHS